MQRDNGANPFCSDFGDTFGCGVIPRLVVGGLKWKALDAGNVHTCGITTSDEVAGHEIGAGWRAVLASAADRVHTAV